MTCFELHDTRHAVPGEVPAGPDTFFELGMTYATGGQVPVDYVSAHKWFNLAAMHGHADAARLRREIAAEMTDADIGVAQRLARDWMKIRTARPSIRAAA